MRILVAPQEFKGTLTAAQAADAMKAGVLAALPDAEVDVAPLSDGGPGLVEAMVTAAGGRLETSRVHGPLGRSIDAAWGLLPGDLAVIEMAAAAGLSLLSPDEYDPRAASTRGVGELMLAALDAGCDRLTVGLGGSATNDGGAGMAQALGARLLDAGGQELPPGGAALAELDRIDVSTLDPRIAATGVIAASDVTNPLCGPEGASLVFGPQKGASTAVAAGLDAALAHYARVIERDMGIAVAEAAGAGAAGGLGAGLIAFCSARVEPGFEVVAEATGLRARVEAATLVMTGEGRLDRQTPYGKTVAGVARLAGEAGVPVVVVPGALGDGWEAVLPIVYGVEPVIGAGATEEYALAHPAEALAAAAARAVSGWRRIEELR